jgi:hypothetical protein
MNDSVWEVGSSNVAMDGPREGMSRDEYDHRRIALRVAHQAVEAIAGKQLMWLSDGLTIGDETRRSAIAAQLADFALTNPDAPVDALWIRAHALGAHANPLFDHVSATTRMAYRVWQATLLATYSARTAEFLAADARARTLLQPASQDAVTISIEGGSLEMLPDPLATMPGRALRVETAADAVVTDDTCGAPTPAAAAEGDADAPAPSSQRARRTTR